MPRNTGFCLERAVCMIWLMSSCSCVNKLHSVGQVYDWKYRALFGSNSLKFSCCAGVK